jgi:hypothetical protein
MKNIPFTFPKAADFKSAPLLPLSQVIAAQGAIDTTLNAPTTHATPAKRAATKDKASGKPSAKKAVGAYHGLNYVVRGVGATKLFAHTAAWLELTGLIHGASAPESLIRELGGSALAYHTKQGNFVTSEGMTKLSDKGMVKFLARQAGGHGAYAQEDMDHYMLMMLSGVNDARLVKNAGSIRKLA